LPYVRFVQPPAEKETLRGQVPTGKSINGGFPFALNVHAKRDAKTKARVESLLKRRAEMKKLRTPREAQKSQEREACIQAYRAKYGQLKGAADLFKRHPGWQENSSAFVSPDGERFIKSMSANNLQWVLLDMEAHVGKKLLNTATNTSMIAVGHEKKVLKSAASQKRTTSKITVGHDKKVLKSAASQKRTTSKIIVGHAQKVLTSAASRKRTTAKLTGGHNKKVLKSAASQKATKAKTAVKAKSKTIVNNNHLPQINAMALQSKKHEKEQEIKKLALQLLNAVVGSGAPTFNNNLKALLDK